MAGTVAVHRRCYVLGSASHTKRTRLSCITTDAVCSRMPSRRTESTETYSSRLKASKSTKRRGYHALQVAKSGSSGPSKATEAADEEGPSTDLAVIYERLKTLALPYFMEGSQVKSARIKLATVVLLTLATTGVSVLFSFLGRDFFNALAAKDQDKFTEMLMKWLVALVLGIPVFVMRDYYQSKLALDWREWMTNRLMDEYFKDRRFYTLQASAQLDNPDQRITSDVAQFTGTTLSLSMTLLNSSVDLISFSGILFSIYPPLFIALLVYSIGGTFASISIGRPLIGLNFLQEAAEADFRYGLVRVRENAESIAFYGGEEKEGSLLWNRLQSVVRNYGDLLIASRRLSFFTSFYRFLIQILPAAVVAPLYFKGSIEFGVVNQSSSAFNHILTDISLVVFQFEALAGFSAVIDRLGELTEVFSGSSGDSNSKYGVSGTIQRLEVPRQLPHLLEVESLDLKVPSRGSSSIPSGRVLIRGLNLHVDQGDSLLIMGPSGSGKTSLLRSIAGLWQTGNGTITLYGSAVGRQEGCGEIFFVPQRPYMVLGTLRDQIMYPTWAASPDSNKTSMDANIPKSRSRPMPLDLDIHQALKTVRLDALLERIDGNLDCLADWAAELSLGEQQRLAFARILLSQPDLVLMDESTSALDATNERILYGALKSAGITFVSVGHRSTLKEYHENVLLIDGDGLGGWRME
jgi:ABC-type uncharacterized transport system fused permease/ATPase subunit